MDPELEIDDRAMREVLRDRESEVKRAFNILSQSNAKNIELIEKLEKGTGIEKIAAARLLGNRKVGATVLALVDALEANKDVPTVALEIVRALRNFHSPEAVTGLFHRLFDGTDEMAQGECRVALSEKGKSAFKKMEIEQYTPQFHKLMEQHGVGIDSVQSEIKKIKGIARSRQEMKAQEDKERRSKEEELARERQTREEVKHMERQVSHQHAIHQHKKKSQSQHPHSQNQHKSKNRI